MLAVEIGLFHEVAFLLLGAAVAGIVAIRLRQPLVVVFVAVGLVGGPSGFGVVEPTEELELLATLGISLLLFVVGLKLDVRLVRAIGPGVLAAGVVQMALTGGAGYALGAAFGLGPLESLYLGLALALSSTVIVLKLLSDRDEVTQIHGRLAVGILIVQDLAVISAMIALTAVDEGGSLARELAEVVLEGAVLLAALAAVTRWVLPSVLHRVAHAQELLVLFAIAWAFALAAGADLLGLSKEVGAFVAGVSLASSSYREAIGGRLVSIRDFLLLFFFVNLGAALEIRSLDARLLALAAAASAVVLVLKPLVTAVPLVLLGYRARPSVRSGLLLAQVSEFSLILTALGLSLAHLDRDSATLVGLVAVVTISVSTYLATVVDPLSRRLAPVLRGLERLPGPEREKRRGPEPDVVVVGLGRYGSGIAEGARAAGRVVFGIDLDPRRLAELRARGLHAVYGDAEDPDLPKRLPLARAEWVISTLRRPEADLALVRALRHHGYRGQIAVASHSREDREILSQAGADRVLTPFADAAAAAAEAVFGEPRVAEDVHAHDRA